MKSMANLIKQAIEANPIFEQKMAYWIHERQRMPNDQWVLSHLIKALGPKYVTQYLGEMLLEQNIEQKSE